MGFYHRYSRVKGQPQQTLTITLVNHRFAGKLVKGVFQGTRSSADGAPAAKFVGARHSLDGPSRQIPVAADAGTKSRSRSSKRDGRSSWLKTQTQLQRQHLGKPDQQLNSQRVLQPIPPRQVLPSTERRDRRATTMSDNPLPGGAATCGQPRRSPYPLAYWARFGPIRQSHRGRIQYAQQQLCAPRAGALTV